MLHTAQRLSNYRGGRYVMLEVRRFLVNISTAGYGRITRNELLLFPCEQNMAAYLLVCL